MEEVIASAYIKKALTWPTIEVGNAKALDEYAIFLKECLHAIEEVGALGVLEYQGNLKAMVERLPYQLHDRWRSVVDARLASKARVRFADLVEFVSKEARKARNPVFGFDALRIETYQNQSKPKPKPAHQPKTQSITTFATNVEANSEDTETEPQRTPCHLCSGDHHLDWCQQFLRRTQEECKNYVIDNSLCFACLGSYHIAKKCKYPKRCRVCRRKHPTSLHIDQISRSNDGYENTGNSNYDTEQQDVHTMNPVDSTSSKTGEFRRRGDLTRL